MDKPVRILSDLHLGHKVSRITQVSSLRPLIAGTSRVIFNGDTWQELAEPFYARALSMLNELQALCREEGTEAVFLPGNHDPSWTEPGWVELAGGRIIITHGDALFRDGSPWKREIILHQAQVQALWSEHPQAGRNILERLQVARKIARQLCSVEHPTGRSFAARAYDAAIPPGRALKMLEAWATQGSAGNSFCETYFPHAELLVLGHFHRTGSWLHGRRRIINTGSFMTPGAAHWMEWHHGYLSRGLIQETPNACNKGEILDVWRFDETS